MARPRPRAFAPDPQDDSAAASKGQKPGEVSRNRPNATNISRDSNRSSSRQAQTTNKLAALKSEPSQGNLSGLNGFGAGQSKPVSSTGSRAANDRAANARSLGKKPSAKTARAQGSQVIPEAVAQRMLRRIAIATGIPSLLGMSVFVVSYLLVSRSILDIPPVATLVASGSCFLLGLVGLSYGVLSASWEDAPGTLLGREQLGVNISRVRSSLKAMRQGGMPPTG